ncbi:MAG: carbon-nitrogen hydrolase family protein [Phycisphaerae bacterium]
MSRLLHVAVLQPELTLADESRSLDRVADHLGQLVRAAPLDLAVLPEAVDGQPPALAEHSAESSRLRLSALARATRVALVAGSVGWLDPPARRRNVAFCFDAAGCEVGRYAKRVPFGREQGKIVPGTEPGLFELCGLRVGVLICSDLWRPELARACLHRADLLCVPARSGVGAETHVPYARELWRARALTRAIENAMPVLVADWPAARHDFRGASHWTAGGSSLVNPAARPDVARLQQTLPDGRPGALRAAIDLDAVAEFARYRESVGLLPKFDSGG